MNKFIITVIFSFIGLICFSQTVNLDDLKKEINTSKNDIHKADLILKLSKHYYLNGNIDSILPNVHKALFIAQKNNYQKGMFIAYKYLGNTYLIIGEKEKALTSYEKALQICRGYRNKKQESDILNDIGGIYESLDNYKKALSIFLISLKLKEAIHDQKGIAKSYDNIGIIYFNENNYAKSLDYYHKSLQLKKKLADSAAMAVTFHNIAYVYECQGKIEKAINTYLLAIKIKKNQKLTNELAISYNNLGSCYDELGLKDSAFFYHKKSFEINCSTSNSKGVALSAFALANDFFNRNKLNSSRLYAEIALDKATKGGNLYIKKSVYNLLSKIYKQQHLLDLALKYNELSQALNDTIYNQDSQRTIAEMSAKYETEKKEIENKNLLSQNKINTLEINNQRIFITSLFILILVLIFVSWLIFSRKDLKQKELLKSELLNQQEIRTKAIIETQEIERKRVAMDLHDGVGQILAGAKMNMASMIDQTEFTSEENKNQMELTMELVDEAYKEVRELAHQMMPKALRDKGLEEALNDLLEKTLANTPVQYAFKNNNYTRLDENIELVLYRVFQETLTNILKHAHATKIIINLHITKLHVVLMVEDNGVGIDLADENSLGIGLSNIRARINTLNGTFLISKGESEGTITVIRIPFNKKNSNLV